MDADSQDVQYDAEAFTDSQGQDSNHIMPTDRGQMVSEHPQTQPQGPFIIPSAVSQQPGQSMPYNMENTPFNAPQSPSLPSKFEHFDAALVFAEGDCELAMGIQKKMNSCKLEKNMFPKVCLYDNPSFPASKMFKGEKVVKRCTLIFVVLTENTHDDMDVQALREEAFGLTRLAPKDELDLEKRYCVRPLHTKSEKDRKGVYKTPCGLRSIESIDWYNYDKPFFQSKMKTLFEFFIPYRLKREKQDNGENPFQTAQLHGTQDINMDSMQGHLNMQSGQAMYQARMNEAPGTVQGNPSSGPPAGRVSENHRQGPGHGNISAQEIPPSDQRWTQPSGNTPSHQDNLPNTAQSQGSLDQRHGNSPALNESSRQRFENQTTSHNPINHPGELSSSTHQESSQANGHDLSIDLNQMTVSGDNESVSCGVQECHESGSTGSEAAAQTSRSPPGALTGLPGPDTGDDHISEGYDDDLLGDGRSSGSHTIPTQDHSAFKKPPSVMKNSKPFSDKSSEQSAAGSSSNSPEQKIRNNSSQQGRPLNSAEDAHSSEAFQSLPEEDLVQDSKSESFSTQGKTPLPDVSWIPSQTEPGGGNPPCSGQEAHTAGDSQSGSVSLGDASGLTRDGPRSSCPPKGLPSDPVPDQTGLDPGADGDSGLGLSDNSSHSMPDLGSASDFLEMVLSELSDGNSSHTGIGETTLPTACCKQNPDPLQWTPSIFKNPDMRRKQVYLDAAKTLLQQCDFLSESKCISDDSEID
ncbi:mucin-19-like isoform X2 [Haliotis rufescens]|uniref:mucin-19-like isoform X2 n=1 Tax=Haliotis rufescens TaxID=6454 RepID=UPI00201FA8F4|nr:mucin-19-like isoform X2 [Haliotis rufescens]